jgi:hypothetical protein
MSVGENLGLIKTRIRKSSRNNVIVYLIRIKLPVKRINIKEVYVARNNIPAAALISLSLRTGVSNPCTCSPN